MEVTELNGPGLGKVFLLFVYLHSKLKILLRLGPNFLE